VSGVLKIQRSEDTFSGNGCVSIHKYVGRNHLLSWAHQTELFPISGHTEIESSSLVYRSQTVMHFKTVVKVLKRQLLNQRNMLCF